MMTRQYKKDARIIFIFLAFVYGFFYQDSSWNGNSRFCLIFASVQDGCLYIDAYHNREGTQTGDKAFFAGHYYSDKAIGQTIVGAVFYVPLYWMQRALSHPYQESVKLILTFLVIGLPSAIAGTLIYILCLYISRSRGKAFLISISICLGTMYFPYSIAFFSHQFASSLLFGAFFMIFFLKEKSAGAKNWHFFLVGLILGWALISEYPTAVIIFALGCYYLSVIWQRPAYRNFRAIILPVIGGCIPILLHLAYNRLCFGSFLSIGYKNLNDSFFGPAMQKGIMGISWPDFKVLYYMTFHPTVGLFWESPVLLLAIVGSACLFHQRQYRAETILAVIIILSFLIIMSGYFMWWGGYALGPRHIIPMLPFFCLPLLFVPQRLNWLFVIFAIVSIGQMTIAAASNILISETMILKIGTLRYFEYSNIYNACLKQLIDGHFSVNMGYRVFGLRSWHSLIPLLVVFAGSCFFFLFDGWKAGQRDHLENAASH